MSPCKLSFRCDKSWETLAPTASVEARFCSDCEKAVFMVKTRYAHGMAGALGRCVGIADDNDFVFFVGEPEGNWDWLEQPDYYKRVLVKASQPIHESRLKILRLLFPKIFDCGTTERLILNGGEFDLGELDSPTRLLLRKEFHAHAQELTVTDAWLYYVKQCPLISNTLLHFLSAMIVFHG